MNRRRMRQTERDRWAYGTPAESNKVAARVAAGEYGCDRCDEPAVSIGRNDAGISVLCRADTLDALRAPASAAARDRIDYFRAGRRVEETHVDGRDPVR